MNGGIENDNHEEQNNQLPWYHRFSLADPPVGFHWSHRELTFHAAENHSVCDNHCFELMGDTETTQAILEGERLRHTPDALRKKMEGLKGERPRWFFVKDKD
jgi:hypothetical protein